MPGTRTHAHARAHTALSMPPRCRYGIKRFKPSEAEAPSATTLRREAKLLAGLKQIAAQDAAHVAFEDLYRIAYGMVLLKRGPVARKMCDDLLRKHALVTLETTYFTMARLFGDLLMYGECTWVRTNRHPPVAKVARDLYARPVARRWRRVWRYLVWVSRLRAWLLAFNAVAFVPDSIGARRAREEFYARAATP